MKKRAAKKANRSVRQGAKPRKPPFTKAKADLQGRVRVVLHALFNGSVASKHVPDIGGWQQSWFHVRVLRDHGVLQQNEDKTWSVTEPYRNLYEAILADWKQAWLNEQRHSVRTADSHSDTNELALS